MCSTAGMAGARGDTRVHSSAAMAGVEVGTAVCAVCGTAGIAGVSATLLL